MMEDTWDHMLPPMTPEDPLWDQLSMPLHSMDHHHVSFADEPQAPTLAALSAPLPPPAPITKDQHSSLDTMLGAPAFHSFSPTSESATWMSSLTSNLPLTDAVARAPMAPSSYAYPTAGPSPTQSSVPYVSDARASKPSYLVYGPSPTDAAGHGSPKAQQQQQQQQQHVAAKGTPCTAPDQQGSAVASGANDEPMPDAVATTTPVVRRRSTRRATGSATAAADDDADATGSHNSKAKPKKGNANPQSRLQRRLVKNRRTAETSRQRKKQRKEELESRVAELEEERQTLDRRMLVTQAKHGVLSSEVQATLQMVLSNPFLLQLWQAHQASAAAAPSPATTAPPATALTMDVTDPHHPAALYLTSLMHGLQREAMRQQAAAAAVATPPIVGAILIRETPVTVAAHA